LRLVSRSHIENTLCFVLLATMAAVVLYPALLLGQLPLDGSSLLVQPPWEEARSDASVGVPVVSPQVQRYYPWSVILRDSVRNGELPLWNSFEGCGTPFFALWRTRCLSPFSVPFYLMAPGAALTLSFFLKLLVAGVATFYAVRRFGFPAPLALMAGAAFELSGHVFGSLGSPMSDVVPWFPFLLLITERLAVGQARYWPAGAALVAIMLLGGGPETVIALLLFCGLYLVVRMRVDRSAFSTFVISLAAFGAIVVVALGLAAIQIAPFVEYAKQADFSMFQDNPVVTRLADTVTWFFPRFFGQGAAEITRGSESVPVNSLTLFHVGLVQILFVPLWFSLRRFVVIQQRRRIEAMLAATVVMTALALFSGPLLHLLPFLARIRPEHLLSANALVVAFLAVAAADEWLALDPEQAHVTIKRMLVALPVVVLFGAAVMYLSYGQLRESAPPLIRQLTVTTVFLAVVVVILAITLLRPSPALMGYGLGIATAIELYGAFGSAVVFNDPRVVFPETQFILSLKEGGTRISGSSALSQWPLAGNLVPQVYSSSGVMLKRQAQFFDKLAQDPLLVRRTGAPALLLTKDDIQGAFASVRPNLKIRRVFSSGAVLFDDLEMKPRAWMTYEVRATDKFDSAMLDANLPPVVEGPKPAIAASARIAKASVLESSTTRVKIRVEDTPPGLLVLSDTFYPGWKAFVDNNPAPVMAVDGLFRGVALDSGAHDVEFIYASRTLGTGLTITLLSAAVVAAAGLWVFFRRGR